jgi:hypothetical protein
VQLACGLEMSAAHGTHASYFKRIAAAMAAEAAAAAAPGDAAAGAAAREDIERLSGEVMHLSRLVMVWNPKIIMSTLFCRADAPSELSEWARQELPLERVRQGIARCGLTRLQARAQAGQEGGRARVLPAWPLCPSAVQRVHAAQTHAVRLPTPTRNTPTQAEVIVEMNTMLDPGVSSMFQDCSKLASRLSSATDAAAADLASEALLKLGLGAAAPHRLVGELERTTEGASALIMVLWLAVTAVMTPAQVLTVRRGRRRARLPVGAPKRSPPLPGGSPGRCLRLLS